MLKLDNLRLGIFEMADTPGIKADKVCQIVRYLTSMDIRVTTALDVKSYQFINYQTMKHLHVEIIRINARPLLENACKIADYFTANS